jgi:hypothetical protein
LHWSFCTAANVKIEDVILYGLRVAARGAVAGKTLKLPGFAPIKVKWGSFLPGAGDPNHVFREERGKYFVEVRGGSSATMQLAA